VESAPSIEVRATEESVDVGRDDGDGEDTRLLAREPVHATSPRASESERERIETAELGGSRSSCDEAEKLDGDAECDQHPERPVEPSCNVMALVDPMQLLSPRFVRALSAQDGAARMTTSESLSVPRRKRFAAVRPPPRGAP